MTLMYESYDPIWINVFYMNKVKFEIIVQFVIYNHFLPRRK